MRKEDILRWVASGLIIIAGILAILQITEPQVSNTNPIETEIAQNEPETQISEKELEVSIVDISIPQAAQAQTAWEAARVNPEDFGIKDTYINPLYVEYAKEITEKYFPNIKASLVISIIEAESSGQAHLVNSKGCKGLMQVYEKYHRARMEKYGVTDLLDPYSNILIGCDILQSYIDMFDGDLKAGLMGYNGSKNAKQRAETGNYTAYLIKVLNRAEELEYYY